MYNGWTNWDTWNANLYLTNDEITYKRARIKAHHNSVLGIKNMIKEIAHIDNIDVNEVNINEIINNFNMG